MREVSLDVPLNMLGEWSGPELVVSYNYTSYSEATSLGVAHLYRTSLKPWQQPTVEGEGEVPAQDVVDDENAPPSPPKEEMPPDYIDGYDRYVVRAVDVKFNSETRRIDGIILLQADQGQLPEEFDTASDVEVRVEGHLNSFECRGSASYNTTETGVETLQPNESFDPACTTRFNL